MTTARVNYINIALMILSAMIAFVIPFELFLFSYAILGPLHYLTEISWLHKRQYFSPKKNDYIFLVVLTVLMLAPNTIIYIYEWLSPKTNGQVHYSDSLSSFINNFSTWGTSLTFIAFAGSAIFILLKSNLKRIVALLLVMLIALAFHYDPDNYDQFSNTAGYLTLSVFLPTLVHVFLFTGAFILVGALKSKSASGYFSILVFVACAFSLFLISPALFGYKASEYAVNSYKVSFESLNRTIFSSFLHIKNADANTVYYSGAGILITRFIAYAYTYHYLNWFSKTSIIKWHEVSRPALIAIGILWVLSIILYITNYRTGLEALLFLSFLHVILEFPLNFQSFKQIGEQVRLRFRPALRN